MRSYCPILPLAVPFHLLLTISLVFLLPELIISISVSSSSFSLVSRLTQTLKANNEYFLYYKFTVSKCKNNWSPGACRVGGLYKWMVLIYIKFNFSSSSWNQDELGEGIHVLCLGENKHILLIHNSFWHQYFDGSQACSVHLVLSIISCLKKFKFFKFQAKRAYRNFKN